MNTQPANLSTDLRRISNWIYEDKLDLVIDNIKKIKNKYRNITKVGVCQNVWEEVDKIGRKKEGNLRSYDIAITLGSTLLQESLIK